MVFRHNGPQRLFGWGTNHEEAPSSETHSVVCCMHIGRAYFHYYWAHEKRLVTGVSQWKRKDVESKYYFFLYICDMPFCLLHDILRLYTNIPIHLCPWQILYGSTRDHPAWVAQNKLITDWVVARFIPQKKYDADHVYALFKASKINNGTMNFAGRIFLAYYVAWSMII